MAYPVSGYPDLQTDRPQGSAAQLGSGAVDVQDVNKTLLGDLESVASKLGQKITIFSGYRTDAYSASVGGFAGDPHTRGYAVDANINGTAAGSYPGAVGLFHALGLGSGATDFTYNGASDPTHVDLLGTSRSYDYAATLAAGGGNASVNQPSTTGTIGEYFSRVLDGLGIKKTAGNLSFLELWSKRENVPQNIDAYNLLGTTQPEPGSHGTNSAGVQSYSSETSGIAATVSELNQSNFSGIKTILGTGTPYQFQGSAQAQNAFKTWSGGGYDWPITASDFPASPSDKDIEGALANAFGTGALYVNPTTGLPLITSAILGGPSTAAGVAGSAGGVVSGVGSAFGSIGDFFSWISNGKNLVRIMEVVFGAVLVILGLLMLTRGLTVGQAAGKLAPG